MIYILLYYIFFRKKTKSTDKYIKSTKDINKYPKNLGSWKNDTINKSN